MQKTFEKAQTGDNYAEEQLFQKLYVRFCYLAKYKIGEPDYEDIAQDACMTVLRKYRQLPLTASFEPWAGRILRNTVGNYIQKSRVVRRFSTDKVRLRESASTISTDPELKLRIIGCLRKLQNHNLRYHQVLRLIHDGFTTDEICSQLNIKESNLYTLLNRSRKVLRDCLYGKGTPHHE